MPLPSWPELHGALTHFPVALLITAAVFEIGALVLKRPTGRILSFWMLVAAVVMAIPSLMAGWMAGRDLFGASSQPPAMFAQHRLMAFVTSGLALLLLLWRVKSHDQLAGGALAVSVVLLLISAGAVGFTGYLGGQMVFGGHEQPGAGNTHAAEEHAGSAAKEGPSTADPQVVETGMKLFRAGNCLSCHKLAGTGGALGPDLTHEAQRSADVEWQVAHLKQPQKLRPGSVMPSYAHLKSDDLNALAVFLTTRR